MIDWNQKRKPQFFSIGFCLIFYFLYKRFNLVISLYFSVKSYFHQKIIQFVKKRLLYCVKIQIPFSILYCRKCYISHKDGFSLSLITRTVYLHIQESKEKKVLYCFIFSYCLCRKLSLSCSPSFLVHQSSVPTFPHLQGL